MAVKAAYWTAGSMPVEAIRSDLFTHVFCAFAQLDRTTNEVVVHPDNRASFTQFNQVLHAKCPTLKTLLSIGGGEGPELADAFATMARTQPSRAVFIRSSIQIARAYGFDGLDLDYETPGTQADMSDLGTLLAEWRAAINEDSRRVNLAPLLLTAAVRYKSTNYNSPPNPYPADSIVTNLDWINVMAYDFTTSARVDWGSPTRTAHTAALYGPVSGSGGVDDWIRANVPASKIVLGIPFYGYGWNLVDSSNHGYDAPATGPTNFNGDHRSVTYRQVRNLPGAATVYDAARVGNYCYQGQTWVSYDDVQAVAAKVAYVKQKGLLGYFAWHLAQDDADFTLSIAGYAASS